MNKPFASKLIDSEIVPVYETDKGEKVVSAKELHESLMASTRFNDWIQRNLLSVGFEEEIDFYSFLSKTNGRPAQEYILKLDTAKHIAMIQRTEIGMQIRQRFIDLEKEVQQLFAQPKSQAELIAMMAQNNLEQERRLTAVEEKQEHVTNILALSNKDWRNKVNAILNGIALKLGGGQYYSDIKNESYKLLEDRAGCSISIRLNNRKAKMALRGSSKTAINKTTALDIIEEDKKLVAVYITVVKELAVKYQLNIEKHRLEDELEALSL